MASTVALKITTRKDEPLYATLLTLAASGFDVGTSVVFDGENSILIDGTRFDNDATIARFVARNSDRSNVLLGENPLERAEIEQHIAVAEQYLAGYRPVADVIDAANTVLAKGNYLVKNRLTVADLVLWRVLSENEKHRTDDALAAFFERIKSDPVLGTAHNAVGRFEVPVPKEAAKPAASKQTKDEGKFIDLPGAKEGEVVVRFPPEASGYLHIGHAKAALLNQYYQLTFKGQLIMRFDDTNPAKENAHFEQVIKEDLKLLDIKPDRWTHSSDHFELLLKYCEQLLREGKAYVDDTDAETMRKEREERAESKNRNSAVEKNLQLWEEMKKGTKRGHECCVRLKIDMNHNNGALRDPTIYRCKAEPHVRTGDKYKVYPTYDFACPIVDSVEGVTHALRTTEYMDRDEQYYFICDALGLRKPYIWAYARLNMQHTVMSKRKLTCLLEDGIVDGWDDPRMPTVRGVLRRGMTVDGLKQFILAQGGSRSVVTMEWDKIWAFNKKVVDPVAPRYTALDASQPLVTVHVRQQMQGSVAVTAAFSQNVALHPKNPEIGDKKVWYSSKLLLEQVDAAEVKPGETVTFVNWGNLKIREVRKQGDVITEIDADLDLENKDYKKTMKVTWLAEVPSEKHIPVRATYYDYVISKDKLEKDEDWKNYINRDSVKYVSMVGEPSLAKLKKGDFIQLQRKSFFICDQAYQPRSAFSQAETPLVLIEIPDAGRKEPKETAPKAAPAKEAKPNKKGAEPSKPAAAASTTTPAAPSEGHRLLAEIEHQGVVVRDLKAKDAKSQETKDAITKLLELKKRFKEVTGVDHKPGVKLPEPAAASPSAATPPASQADSGHALLEEIEKQGTVVRDHKAKDAKSQATKDAIAKLLDLKKRFKEVTGLDHKPGVKLPEPAPAASTATVPAPASQEDSGHALLDEIEKQGVVVRDLKAKDAKSQATKDAIAKLLDLKKRFKEVTGLDHKPGVKLPEPAPAASTATVPAPASQEDSGHALLDEIEKQGVVVRDLKAKDAKSQATKDAIAKLLDLKKRFKEVTGLDHRPGLKLPESAPGPAPTATAPPATAQVDHGHALLEEIEKQGTVVRDFKAKDAKSQATKDAIAKLLDLKKRFKEVTGLDHKPGVKLPESAPGPAPAATSTPPTSQVDDGHALLEEIEKQGTVVRDLKAKDAKSQATKDAIARLLDLKKRFKEVTGLDHKPGVKLPESATGNKIETPAPTPQSSDDAKKQPPKSKKMPWSKPTEEKPPAESTAAGGKKQTKLGIETHKEDNYSEWYSQVITKAEMIEYYDVSGCYVLRPWAFSIWESIKKFFDIEIKKLGVRNAYFPMFVSAAALEREKTHISDFAPEVAWVTRAGQSEMAEPIAIRPTSETVMYPSFAKWCQSHRDLPIKVNQWCNVVRWEFKHPTPFLRTREFLWQEGHTAYQTPAEAEKEVFQILDLYAKIYTDLLAIPVVKGRKSEKEKFAGGDFTTTVEAYVDVNGRGIQGGTSHHLGQNFSKMFDICFEDPDRPGEKVFAWQNSWGLSTRTIGAMVMIHGDNKGLVLPPRVAAIQAVVVPVGITAHTTDDEKRRILDKACEISSALVAGGIRAEPDVRDNVSPGWKFNHWELKGVPIRLEVGPKDLAKGEVLAVFRFSGEKRPLSLSDKLAKTVSDALEETHRAMYRKAETIRDEHMKLCLAWSDFGPALDKKCILLSPFCGDIKCEEQIKEDSAREEPGEAGTAAMGAKTLCIPLEQPKERLPERCINPKCTNKAKFFTLFGRSY